ncbi:MAG TPA: CpsB/CapC family capsule biosynthesis tyrosine phosphatase [Thermoanaerobaculia bacterium]|nr:CpsB/CapC family capsule biosynthesis tyrosine phosphatase [Thermoanaerobaculia bacterium]
MIDLHCHILPGIDDGAKTLDEAIDMCRMAAAEGCRAMVATPHQRRGAWWNADRENITGLARDLQAAVGSSMRIFLGGEVHADSDLLSEVERLPAGGIFTLAGSKYLLIELSINARGTEAIHLVHELTVAGWRPILAHPELIPWLAEDFDLIARLIALGARVQVTAMSVTGDFGRGPQENTHTLIEAGLAHFVASDCHDRQRRPPGLRRAYRTIARRWGAEVAKRLVSDNPRAVVQNRPLPEMERQAASEA